MLRQQKKLHLTIGLESNMEYFEHLPKILYHFNVGGKPTLITIKDIALNVRFKRNVLDNISLYDTYDVRDNESPEIISHKYYGKAGYHWIIMLFNDVYNLSTDWVKSEVDVFKLTTMKYGAGNEYDHHMIFGNLHYVDRNDNIVMGDVPFASPVNNLNFEIAENEKKRTIKLISPLLIDQVVFELESNFN